MSFVSALSLNSPCPRDTGREAHQNSASHVAGASHQDVGVKQNVGTNIEKTVVDIPNHAPGGVGAKDRAPAMRGLETERLSQVQMMLYIAPSSLYLRSSEVCEWGCTLRTDRRDCMMKLVGVKIALLQWTMPFAV